MKTFSIANIVTTTSKAILLTVNGVNEWFPISQIEISGFSVNIPIWLLSQKELNF